MADMLCFADGCRCPQIRVHEGFSGWLPLSPLCSPVLEPDLDSGLTQVQTKGQFFASEDIRIRRSLERFLQLLQLIASECRSSLLLLSVVSLTVVAATSSAAVTVALTVATAV